MTTYRMTTSANSRIGGDVFYRVTKINVSDTLPAGTSIRYMLRAGNGAWAAFKGGVWKAASNQALTNSIVLNEGNTSAELNALVEGNLSVFNYQTIDISVAFQTNLNNIPTLNSFVISGFSGKDVSKEADLPQVLTQYNGAPSKITDINFSKTENGGTIDLVASLQGTNGAWSQFQAPKSFIGQTGKAMKFKSRGTLKARGQTVKINSISVQHETMTPSRFGNTGECITKYYTLPYPVSELHMNLKHSVERDTRYSAYISFQEGSAKEQWIPMQQDILTDDTRNKGLVNEQFDYIAGAGKAGKHFAIRVVCEQMSGTVPQTTLGTGTGSPVSYKLPHHARTDTIKVTPANASWTYDNDSDAVSITAPANTPVTISYSWLAKTPYLKSMRCFFNE